MQNRLKKVGIEITLLGLLYFGGVSRQHYNKVERLAREVGLNTSSELYTEEGELCEKIRRMEEENIESKMITGSYRMYGNPQLTQRYEELRDRYFELSSKSTEARNAEERCCVDLLAINSLATLLFILSARKITNYWP